MAIVLRQPLRRRTCSEARHPSPSAAVRRMAGVLAAPSARRRWAWTIRIIANALMAVPNIIAVFCCCRAGSRARRCSASRQEPRRRTRRGRLVCRDRSSACARIALGGGPRCRKMPGPFRVSRRDTEGQARSAAFGRYRRVAKLVRRSGRSSSVRSRPSRPVGTGRAE